MLRKAVKLDRTTFFVYVSTPDFHRLARRLGYGKSRSQGEPTLLSQPDVGLFRSKLHGNVVYLLKHKNKVYVFARD
jgi:hypothetical protein